MRIVGITARGSIVAVWMAVVGCAHHHPQASLLSPEHLYNEPLVSPGTQFTRSPPPVQRAITAEAGAAEIDQITRFTNQNRVIYVVRFANRWLFPPLYVAGDGSILAPDLRVELGAPIEDLDLGGVITGSGRSPLHLADLLPPDVLRVLQERALITDIAHLSKEKWGDRPIYIVTFRDPAQNPTLYIQSDGTILNEKHR